MLPVLQVMPALPMGTSFLHQRMCSSSGYPFRIVPWDTDFLTALKDGVLASCANQPGRAVLVFPHDRPRRYLTHLFRHDPVLSRPCLLPSMLTVSELMRMFRETLDSRHRREARRLDRIALLSAVVRHLAGSDANLCRRLAETDDARFFPWGGLLADLMEECLLQGLEPDDLHYTEGEVAPMGAALLGSLRSIFHDYLDRLDQRGLYTPGFDAFTTAKHAARYTESLILPPQLRGRRLFLAGFSTLTETEDRLFHRLWREGAYIYLHADPDLAHFPLKKGRTGHSGTLSGHWACGDIARWIADWDAPAELVCSPSEKKTGIHFFAGYDLHSQLSALIDDLEAFPVRKNSEVSTGETAVVLTHSGALLPVLHELPGKDCNISLGYPLERTLLFRLIETILGIRAERRADGKNHWRHLLDLLRHPYLRLLVPPDVSDTNARDFLQHMEHRLLSGTPYVVPRVLATGAIGDFLTDGRTVDQATLAHLSALADTLITITVDIWGQARTPGQLANALGKLCELLLTHGRQESADAKPGEKKKGEAIHADHVWQRFPLDAECLYRLIWCVIPELRDTELADVPLSWPLLEAMLLELLRGERIPFEADPLTGLQVLGMLETRLLHFSHVHVIDVTEDRLPGSVVRNPLLPDSLRAVLGLPDTRRRDQVAAYTFHRLIAGAEEVFLYWQEGVQPSGLFDGKKERSRFVEELIWREEQRCGYRFKTGKAPLRAAAPRLRPPGKIRRIVSKTPALRAMVVDSLCRPWSSTRLDVYLACPLRYYYQEICGLVPAEEVNEGDDPVAVGNLVHETLRTWYQSREGQSVCLADPRKRAQAERELCTCFLENLDSSGLAQRLPPESVAMLRVAGPERLRLFLRNQPDETYIVALEKRYSCTLSAGGRNLTLNGTLDRVDMRTLSFPPNGREQQTAGRGAVILDYKTGRLKLVSSGLWNDEAFWDHLFPDGSMDHVARCQEESSELLARLRDPDPNRDILPGMARHLPSLQLPYYMYLYAQATGQKTLEAAFVELGDSGEEKELFGPEVPEALRDDIIQRRIPALMGLILLHLEHCPEFRPNEGRHCDWCSWRDVCIIADREH